jgi:hypothetical protein
MKNTVLLLILFSFFSTCLTGCTPKKQFGVAALPPIIVYKTRQNYDKNVAVMLSDDKKSIVSYPHPSDVSVNSYPTPLKNGYLLDNRGIGKNTAFISLTYEEYAALEKVPSIAELYNLIIDKDPLLRMYSCGNRIYESDLVTVLNQWIDKKCKNCERIK